MSKEQLVTLMFYGTVFLLFNLTLNGTVNIFPEANEHNVEDGSFKNNMFT